MGDPVMHGLIPLDHPMQERIAKPLLAVLVMATGMILARRARTRRPAIVDLAPEDQK
jgi:hypothetical protein